MEARAGEQLGAEYAQKMMQGIDAAQSTEDLINAFAAMKCLWRLDATNLRIMLANQTRKNPRISTGHGPAGHHDD